MNVSAKADYGMRAMLELVASYEKNPTAVVKGEVIARAQQVPVKFLEAILRQLRLAGLISATRGPDGGYRLDRPPTDVSVADVIRALDGPLAAVHGSRPEDLVYGGAAEHLREVWVAARAAIRDVLEHVTIAQIAHGDLPPEVRDLLAEPGAWQRR